MSAWGGVCDLHFIETEIGSADDGVYYQHRYHRVGGKIAEDL